MQKSDMHQAYIRSLMLLVGGVPRAGEMDAWLARISRTTGIGFRSLRAAYYGQWISKNQYVSNNTLQKLEWAADDARKTNDIVAFTELQIEIWKTSPGLFEPHITLARKFCDDLVSYDARRRGDNRSVVDEDRTAAAAAAAGLSAAGAKA